MTTTHIPSTSVFTSTPGNTSSLSSSQIEQKYLLSSKENFLSQLRRARAALFLLCVSLVCFVPFFYTGYTIGLIDIQPFWIRGVLGVGVLSLAFSLLFFVWYGLENQKIERPVIKDLVGNTVEPTPLEENIEKQIKKIMWENKLLVLSIISIVLLVLNIFIAYTQTYHSEKVVLSFSQGKTYTSMFRVARPETYNIEIEIEKIGRTNEKSAENVLCRLHPNEWSEEQRQTEQKYRCALEPIDATLTLTNEKEVLFSTTLKEPIQANTIITPTLRRLASLELKPGVNYHYQITTQELSPYLKTQLENKKIYALIEPTYTTQRKNLETQKWYRYYWRLSVGVLILNVLGFFWFLSKTKNKNFESLKK